MGIPLNRLENDFYRMGLVLPRANMAHWVIRCSDEWLSPIYNRIHEELLKCEILHMDETRIQVNKESGKKASSDSFMWVIRSGEYESIRATFFHYARTRGKSVAIELLTGFQGYLTTDGYTVYENLNVEGIAHNFCWAHLRRYYIESIPLDNNGRELEGSKGAEANELNVYEYLKHILSFMPNADFYNHPEVIDDLMPWSENLPQECRLEQNNKKHFKK